MLRRKLKLKNEIKMGERYVLLKLWNGNIPLLFLSALKKVYAAYPVDK